MESGHVREPSLDSGFAGSGALPKSICLIISVTLIILLFYQRNVVY
jgi:hypothetical protein